MASTHAATIDTNQNQEITWGEMSRWAQTNGQSLPEGLHDILSAEKPAGFSWQKIARDTGSQLHTSRTGGQYYTFDYAKLARSGGAAT